MAESGYQKFLIIVGLLLICLIGALLVTLHMMRGEVRGGISDGIQSVAEREIREKSENISGFLRDTLQGGAPVEKESLVYERELMFHLTPRRLDSQTVRVEGTVQNVGDKTVTFLKAYVILLDTEGKQVAGRTDYFAHSLPVGDNASPILPKGSVHVTCDIVDDGRWTDGSVRVDVQKIAIKD